MNLKIIPLLSLILIAGACGDNSPFDEDYWEQPEEDVATGSATANQNFRAAISPIGTTLGNISGTVTIVINETDVDSTTQLIEVPQSLMIGQRSITNQTCSDVAASFPPPDIVNETSEFKNFDTEDNGSRESLIAELNQDDPSNGDSVNLDGKSYVIKAYVENVNTPTPTSIVLIPIACGTILRHSTSSGGVAGGITTGGTVGNIGGSIGGIDGAVGGSAAGTSAGTVGGVGGSIGGIAGSVGGSAAGTVGGTGGGIGGTIPTGI